MPFVQQRSQIMVQTYPTTRLPGPQAAHATHTTCPRSCKVRSFVDVRGGMNFVRIRVRGGTNDENMIHNEDDLQDNCSPGVIGIRHPYHEIKGFRTSDQRREHIGGLDLVGKLAFYQFLMQRFE